MAKINIAGIYPLDNSSVVGQWSKIQLYGFDDNSDVLAEEPLEHYDDIEDLNVYKYTLYKDGSISNEQILGYRDMNKKSLFDNQLDALGDIWDDSKADIFNEQMEAFKLKPIYVEVYENINEL